MPRSERKRSEHELREAIRALHEEAAGEPFTDEQKERWNELNAELDEQEKRRERIRQLANDPRHVERIDGGVDDQPMSRRRTRVASVPRHLEESRAQGLAAIDSIADVLDGKAAARLEEFVEADIAGSELGATSRYLGAASSREYLSAFGKLLANPQSAHLQWSAREHEAVDRVNRVMSEQRALGIGNQGGGYPVPIVIDPTVLLTSSGVVNPIRQVARVVQITGNHWTGVASTGTTATFAAEFTEVADNSPTLTQPTADVEKAQAWIPYSIEAGEDWGSLQQELGRLLQDAKDTLEATKFLKGVGHGSNEPLGLLVAGTTASTTAATGVLAIGDVYAALRAVPTRWQASSRWLAAPATYDAIYRLVGGGNTTEPPLMASREGPLLGREKYEWSTYTSGTVTGSTVATVGDFSNFLILDRLGMQVSVVPFTFGTALRPNGGSGLYAHWRTTSLSPTGGIGYVSIKIKQPASAAAWARRPNGLCGRLAVNPCAVIERERGGRASLGRAHRPPRSPRWGGDPPAGRDGSPPRQPQRDAVSVRDNLVEGIREGFPLCCIIRYTVEELLWPGRPQALDRGGRKDGPRYWVPCGLFHKATRWPLYGTEDEWGNVLFYELEWLC